MNELNATIDAATLKYITSVLAQVDDQAVFEITPKSMSCRITDAAKTPGKIVITVNPAVRVPEVREKIEGIIREIEHATIEEV